MNPARRLGLATVLIGFVADQVLKCWLLYGVGLAENGPFDLAPLLTIVVAWNRGISYGLFQQNSEIGRWGLIVISILAAVVATPSRMKGHAAMIATRSRKPSMASGDRASGSSNLYWTLTSATKSPSAAAARR